MTALEKYISSYFGITKTTDISQLTTLFHPKTVKKGAYLLKSGEYCNTLCFVQSGLLRMFVHTDGKEVTQWISATGSFSTDLSSLLFDTPSRWSIQALVTTDIYYISKENYRKLGDLVQGWEALEKRFLAHCFTILEDRVFSHLSMSAEERYHAFFKEHKELFNQVPLQYIASMLGMTPETFSRIRKKQTS